MKSLAILFILFCGGSPFCFSNDGWIVKVDSSLKMQWEEAIGGSDDDQANAIIQTDDGGYITAGWKGNYWIVKLAPDHTAAVATSTNQSTTSTSSQNFSVFPNPAGNEITLSFPFSNNIISILDLFGRELKQLKVENGNLKLLDLSFLQQGVYVVEIKDEKGNVIAEQKLFRE